MSATYKVKLTRPNTSVIWPLSNFISDVVFDPTDPNRFCPIGIPNFNHMIWPETPGFVSYSYEEYDASTDTIATELLSSNNYSAADLTDVEDMYVSNFKSVFLRTNNLLDRINEQLKMIYNPSSLTLTSVVEFDNLTNLVTFINLANSSWDGSVTKSRFQSYLTDTGITLVEEIYENGVLNTTTGASAF